jgi:uncharacterized membrane protein YdfJ with MMPL/SSD domain
LEAGDVADGGKERGVFGRANWWMPSWLDRAVPRLAPEAL